MTNQPKDYIKGEGAYALTGEARALAHPCLTTPVLREFWNNFSFRASTLTVEECDEYIFTLGEAQAIPLEGYDSVIRVTPQGIYLTAKGEKELIRGFMTLLGLFRATDKEEGSGAELPCCTVYERPTPTFRAVHFCIFPETELWELRRFIRFAGALKYTHIVLEFWGMLRYDCMAELAWSHAFSKDEVRPLMDEARELGLEIIPMFNHWGHAPASRVMHGKHVVLDQNPALQSYFSEDGWCWDIKKTKVRALLCSIRRELTELCGDGSYFHIGCDEAYGFSFTEESIKEICDFINGIAGEMQEEGRRILMWGDMLLYYRKEYNPKNRYTCGAPTLAAEEDFLQRLDKNIVIADWQYDAPQFPVETASVFSQAGFDCVLCPWDRGVAETRAALATVREQGLMGYLHTTWHTLTSGMMYVYMMAQDASYPFNWASASTATAALLRKVLPAGGVYEKAGWSKIQVHSRW